MVSPVCQPSHLISPSEQVIPRIGLAITLYDVLRVSDGVIGYGTGKANVNVDFRLIVFRPFKGEIILGQISSASEEGIRGNLIWFFFRFLLPQSISSQNHTTLSRLFLTRSLQLKLTDGSHHPIVRLDFFDEILVPPHLLLPNSHLYVLLSPKPFSPSLCSHLTPPNSNVRERVWQWTNDADEYYYDKSEWVRIRIEDEKWADGDNDNNVSMSTANPQQRPPSAAQVVAETTQERKSPWSLTVRCFFSSSEILFCLHCSHARRGPGGLID